MMNRNKSKKKRSPLFNIIDIITVFVIAIVISYLVYVNILGHSLNDIGSKKVNIEYTVLISEVDTAGFSKIAKGDTVMSEDGKTELGNISSLKAYLDKNGVLVAEVTVRAQAYTRKGSYRIDKIKILPNEKTAVRFPGYFPSTEVRCIDIRVI